MDTKKQQEQINGLVTALGGSDGRRRRAAECCSLSAWEAEGSGGAF